jgi:hypothetical protein
MTAFASSRPATRASVPARRFRLTAGPDAVTQARAHVRAAVRDWGLPVSENMAVLLTWHLVTSVTSEGPGGANGTEGPAGSGDSRAERDSGADAAGGAAAVVTLGISCSRGALRVDVYDGRRSLPSRGYEIVASMADDWGIYRTPAGRAVYFTLAFTGTGTGQDGGSPRAPQRSLADTSAD